MSMTEKQIKQLERVRDKFFNWKTWEYNVIDSAIDTIRTLSAKVANENMISSSQYYHHGWIPCSEHMPQEYGNYLATLDDGDVEEVTWHSDNMRWSTCEASGYREIGNNEVIAWMPLPEEYKEVEE